MAQYGGYNPYAGQQGQPNSHFSGQPSPYTPQGGPGAGQNFGDPSQTAPSQPQPGQFGGAPPQQPPPQQQEGYFHQGGQAPGSGQGMPQQGGGYGIPGTPDQVGGLTQQMGAMGMGADGAGGPAARKKKNRHAYHDLSQPTGAAPQQFNGMPQDPRVGAQFLNQPGGQQPYAGQQPPPGAVGPYGGSQSAAFSPGPRAGGMGAPMATEVQGMGVQTQGRVDPDQIPSVPRSRDGPATYYLDHPYLTMEQHHPPPAAVPYIAFDQGNSSPKYARLTLNDIPATSEALASTSLPLGVLLQPLATLSPGEQPIPVLDFGETGPPRCRRCRTYINPFMTFRSGGNKFVCNMCTFPNDVPSEYFAPTDPSSVRVDRESRPELKLGTVEFTVPKEYWAKEPVPLRHLFVIDVGQDAINKGSLEVFCNSILQALYGDKQEDGEEKKEPSQEDRTLPAGCKVGFVTYDRDVHFYNCSSKLTHAQMLVMPDIEDPFLPLGTDGLFVDPHESKSLIISLLKQLPQLFSNVKYPDLALLSTLTACMDALAATGGKIICSLSALPSYGPGKLHMRDDKNLHGVETEKKLFQTENQNWRKCANKMVEHGIGVDFFILTPAGAYVDVAAVGYVSALSGGEVFYYPNFHAPRDLTRVASDVKHTVTRETGYQALMKVRCSNGLQVSSYYGNFQQHNFGADLEFGTIDADKAVAVMFSYDGKLDPKLDAHFQCALLYTTQSGERRVRCTNTVASVSEGGAGCLRHADQDAVVAMIAKEAASRMTERPLKDIRNAITEKTIDIIGSYRKSYSSSNPPGQLVLPELLKELCMYTLSLVKTRAFKAGIEPSDRRTYSMRQLRSAPLSTLSLLLYPRIYSLHDLESEAGFPNVETGHLVVPQALRASFARIQEGGAYLVSDGQNTLLWLHAQVSPNLLEDLFGPGQTDLQALDPNLSALPVLQTHLSAQVRNLLAYWGSDREGRPPPVQLARQGLDGAEFEFARVLFEDRNAEAQSYVDWLVHVHRGVQMELSGQRGKKEREQAEQEGTLAGLRAMGW